MHMADALLSPAVGVAMYAVSTGALARSTSKINSEVLEKKIPIMAVAGSFVFAAQMINFTIPATGSSGHIGGGILLAAMLAGAAPPTQRHPPGNVKFRAEPSPMILTKSRRPTPRFLVRKVTFPASAKSFHPCVEKSKNTEAA